MLHAGVVAQLLAVFGDLPRKGDGAVFAAGAAHRNGQLAFALLDVERQRILQKALVAFQQFLCLRVAHDKIHHLLIQAGLVLELRHIEWIGQAADVQHQVCLRRHTELETEGHDGEPHGPLGPAVPQEQIADALFILCGGEQCRIDGVVGPLLKGLKDLTLNGKSLPGGDVFRDADGMAAAGLAVTAHQHIVGGVKEQDLVPDALLVQLLQRRFDLLFAAAAANVHAEGDPLQLVVARLRECRDAGQEAGRDVINAKKANVFQRIHGDGFARARKSADDQKIHVFLPLSHSAGTTRISFSRS